LRSVTRHIKTLRIPLFLWAGWQDKYAQHSMYNLDTLAKGAGKVCETFTVPGDHFSSVEKSIDRSVDEFMRARD
jgi:hypothetical protein